MNAALAKDPDSNESVEANGQASEARKQLELTPRESDLIRALRLLGTIHSGAFDDVEAHLWDMVARNLRWSYDDPASLALAAEFMGLDPFVRREVLAINEEFEPALSDGLEKL